MERRKALILSTLCGAIFLFSAAALYQKYKPVQAVKAQIAGMTLMGNPAAKIEIVVIEDFLCKNCRKFSLEILPQIQSHYIAKGKAKLILIPVAYLNGSKMIANAVMDVYKQAPDRLFTFLTEVIHNSADRGLKPSDILRIATRMGGIDLAKLESCINKGSYDRVLEENLEWARTQMGHGFRTPAVFINGYPASTFSFLAIRDQIRQMMEGGR